MRLSGTTTVCCAENSQDGRQGTRRPARQTAAARVLVSAEARQRAAAAKAAERRERAAAEARGKLLGQEEADQAALEVGDADPSEYCGSLV